MRPIDSACAHAWTYARFALKTKPPWWRRHDAVPAQARRHLLRDAVRRVDRDLRGTRAAARQCRAGDARHHGDARSHRRVGAQARAGSAAAAALCGVGWWPAARRDGGELLL